ncbi:MAG: calcium-binding protein [Solirubrobacterales bacterium]
MNSSPGGDVLEGQGGADTIDGGPAPGDGTLDPSDPFDVVDFTYSPQGVVVNLYDGTASGEGADLLHNVEDIVGTPFNDELTGNGLDNAVQALQGNDYIYTGDGLDTLFGEVGDDYIDGGPGVDIGNGGPGTDTCRNINNPVGGAPDECETRLWDQCGEFDNCRRQDRSKGREPTIRRK